MQSAAVMLLVLCLCAAVVLFAPFRCITTHIYLPPMHNRSTPDFISLSTQVMGGTKGQVSVLSPLRSPIITMRGWRMLLVLVRLLPRGVLLVWGLRLAWVAGSVVRGRMMGLLVRLLVRVLLVLPLGLMLVLLVSWRRREPAAARGVGVHGRVSMSSSSRTDNIIRWCSRAAPPPR